jgi:hypothetical protein
MQLGEPMCPLSAEVFAGSDPEDERWLFAVSTTGRYYLVVVDGLPDFLALLGRLTALVEGVRRCEWDQGAAMLRCEWDALTSGRPRPPSDPGQVDVDVDATG